MKKISKKNITPEYGFGTKAAGIGQRLMNADGSANVKRLGEPAFQAINIYHWLLTMSWRKFNLIVLCFYLLFNVLFACIYYVLPHGSLGGMIYETPAEKFMEYFFQRPNTFHSGLWKVEPDWYRNEYSGCYRIHAGIIRICFGNRFVIWQVFTTHSQTKIQ